MHSAQQAYGQAGRSTRTPRATEYEAFARVTRRLQQAENGPRTTFGDLAAAVHDNRRLWSILAADLAGHGNGLPEELRARLLSLARFTDDHSARVLGGTASASVLIEVNTAVMQGLRDRGATA
ncbi:flagellar biosynthesis regulator FlaF [Roseovarius salinarum]|uniref:flagellar biosynthesis regulator FlaF n=1 Tax=Roseovarius salinarum TaxID=1981892 RepID=UPI002FCD9427